MLALNEGEHFVVRGYLIQRSANFEAMRLT